METNPLNIILVKSDSKGDRLLFRYPYISEPRTEISQKNRKKNPYALTSVEDLLQSPPPQTSNIHKGHLTGLTDEVLSILFAVKPELCERKFELKINDVRFVGHPTLLSSSVNNKYNSSSRVCNNEDSSIILINVVFALHATAGHSIVKCYYDLSKRLGIALRHEEERCGYVTKEAKLMVSAHDDVAARIENGIKEDPEHAFELILDKSSLAQDLRCVYESLCSTGVVDIAVNKWITVSFCLPQKVHQLYRKDFIIEPETIYKCLGSLRPYHGILLLVKPHELLSSFSFDASTSMKTLIKVYSPLKSLQVLAADADLTQSQVFQLTGHLLYWAKATVIYPVCESNVYVIAPDAPLNINSLLIEKFTEEFPGVNLFEVISDFSQPTSLRQKASPMDTPEQDILRTKMVVWMLQHRLLLQLHTYVQFMPTSRGTSLSPQMARRQSHPLHHNSTRDGSYQSTPDDHTGYFGGRIQSESDLSSNMSDDNNSVISPPGATASMPITNAVKPVASAVVSSDNEVNFLNMDDKASLVREELLNGFSETQRIAILRIPAASNPEDLHLLAKLIRLEYFRGHHHLEEIMYKENIRRSQLLQLIDKFRDILISYETEDPTIAVFYSHSFGNR